jgi:hypothetical protein
MGVCGVVGVWIFRAVRVLLAIAATGLAVAVVAYMATGGSSLSIAGGPEWKIWVGLGRIAAVYLLPLSLFVVALWPRTWPLALLLAVFLGASEAILTPDALIQGVQRIVG